MKKTYIQPSMMALQIAAASIMAGSTTVNVNPGETATEWGAKGHDFFTDPESAEKNEYPVYSLWED